MRILIAEDDQVLADGLLRALRGAGAAVDHVLQPGEQLLVAPGEHVVMEPWNPQGSAVAVAAGLDRDAAFSDLGARLDRLVRAVAQVAAGMARVRGGGWGPEARGSFPSGGGVYGSQQKGASPCG